MDKRELKKTIRLEQRKRNAWIPDAKLQVCSEEIFQRLITLPVFEEARSIFCYASTNGEISSWGILEHVLKTGRELSVPRCLGDGIMQAGVIHQLSELHRGRYGIMEPPETAVVQPSPDVCILPCVACTENGIRLGQGGGYYDRYLASHANTTSILLCGSWQLSSSLPFEDTDMTVDWIVSENKAWEA